MDAQRYHSTETELSISAVCPYGGGCIQCRRSNSVSEPANAPECCSYGSRSSYQNSECVSGPYGPSPCPLRRESHVGFEFKRRRPEDSSTEESSSDDIAEEELERFLDECDETSSIERAYGKCFRAPDRLFPEEGESPEVQICDAGEESFGDCLSNL